MRQSFDYQPIVEIDMSDPCGQLCELLENYQNYLPLIERNYEFVRDHHQWPNRIEMIRAALVDFERRASVSFPDGLN
jgi:hypothetical protein